MKNSILKNRLFKLILMTLLLISFFGCDGNFVPIPEGTFFMGSSDTEKGRKNERVNNKTEC